MKQQEGSLPSAGIRFLNREKVLGELKKAASALKKERTEVVSVILFGSLAKGDYTGGSDADLIVVLKETQESLLERIIDFRRYFTDIPVPIDILVYTLEELAQMEMQGRSIALDAKRGVLLA